MKKYIVHKSGLTPKTQTEINVMVAIEQLTKPDPHFEPKLSDLKYILDREIEEMPRRSIALPKQMFSLVLEPEFNPKVLRIYRKTKAHTDVWVSVSIKEEELKSAEL